MFRFMQEPSSGRYNQCLAKITNLVLLCVSVHTLLVLRPHILTWCVCVLFTVSTSLHSEPHTHTHQVRICRHNTNNVCTDTHSRTGFVILAKHWL